MITRFTFSIFSALVLSFSFLSPSTLRAQQNPIPPSSEELGENDYQYDFGGMIRASGSFGKGKKKFETTDSYLTIGLPIPGHEEFEFLVTLGGDFTSTKENGQSNSEWNKDDIIRQFAFKYYFGEINERPVVIMAGKMDVSAGLEVRKIGDYTNNPLIAKGLTRRHGMMGFAVEVPLSLKSEFDSIKGTVYASEEGALAAAAQLVTYVKETVKAVISVDYRGKKQESSSTAQTVANVGIVYHEEGGSLTAWLQGIASRNFGKDDWDVAANIGFAYKPFEMEKLELVVEATFSDEQDSVAAGLNYHLGEQTMVSLTLRKDEGESGLTTTITVSQFIGKRIPVYSQDPMMTNYQ